MITLSEGRLIGNIIFLTVGPYTAAQIGLRNPQLLWPAIFLLLAIRVGVELVLHARRQRLARPRQIAQQLHNLMVEDKARVVSSVDAAP